jgi:hypothetical protein
MSVSSTSSSGNAHARRHRPRSVPLPPLLRTGAAAVSPLTSSPLSLVRWCLHVHVLVLWCGVVVCPNLVWLWLWCCACVCCGVRSYCVTQFLEKDPSLAPGVVRSVLKFWPVTSSKKELMFLSELEEILDRIQAPHLAQTQIPLFRQISKSINSPHFQVSERAIYVLNNDAILRFIANNRQSLVPILCRALYSNTHLQGQVVPPGSNNPNVPASSSSSSSSSSAADGSGSGSDGGPPEGGTGPRAGATFPVGKKNRTGHWNPTIVELTKDILKLFTEMDAELMEKCNAEHIARVKAAPLVTAQKKSKWQSLEQRSASAPASASASAASNPNAPPPSAAASTTPNAPPPQVKSPEKK